MIENLMTAAVTEVKLGRSLGAMQGWNIRQFT